MAIRDLFWELLETEHPAAERFCRRLVGDVQEAEDLYQEALIRAFNRFGTLRNQDSFRPWLYRIIVNTFKSRLRKFGRRVNKSEVDLDRVDGLAHDPRAQLQARLWLERALTTLSPADRALITLFELEGWSLNELADLSGTPLGTVKSRISRARKKMLKEMERLIAEGKIVDSLQGGMLCAAAKQNAE